MSLRPPGGVKHAPCLDHVPHPYPSSGWLCIGTDEPSRADDMRAFADHLAAVAARHRGIVHRLDMSGSLARYIVWPGDRIVSGPTLAECDWTFRVLSSQLPVESPSLAREIPASSNRSAVRSPAPRATVKRSKTVTATYDPDAPHPLPDPVAPRDALAPSRKSRPTCDRCGQLFKTDNGYQWHRANRPTCSAQARKVA